MLRYKKVKIKKYKKIQRKKQKLKVIALNAKFTCS